jgi:hypothetical protein
VTGAHVETPGEAPKLAAEQNAQTVRLLHFNGDLDFGGVATRFTEVSNTPTFSVGGLTYVNTSLAVTNLSGTVSSWDTYQFGNDELLTEVRLFADGSAAVITGEALLAPDAGVEIEDAVVDADDISYFYNTLKLTPSGPVAGEDLAGSPTNALTLLLPAGVGYTNDSFPLQEKLLLDLLNFAGPLALDDQFSLTSPVSQSPSSRAWLYQEGRPYGVEFDNITFDGTGAPRSRASSIFRRDPSPRTSRARDRSNGPVPVGSSRSRVRSIRRSVSSTGSSRSR